MTEILTESFCERCGTRYTFESAKQRVRLKRVKVLSRGLKNFVLSDDTSMDEAMAAARSETDREASSHTLDAFHKTFNFCMSCRQYTCPNCWNEAEVRCLTCAPLALPAEEPAGDDLSAFRLAALLGEASPANGTEHEHDTPTPTSTDDAAASSAPSPYTIPDERSEIASRSAAEPETPVVADAEPAVDAPSVPIDQAGKAVAQTTGLLKRFRPGQSLDDELAAFERQRDEVPARAEEVDEGVAAAASEATERAVAEAELETPAEGAPAADVEAEAPFEAAAEIVAPAEIAGPSEVAEPEADVSTVDTSAPVSPEPAVVEPPAPEPEAAPQAASSGADVVEQPTWRITAPDAGSLSGPIAPPPGEVGTPLQAGPGQATAAEPQWPARPQWPDASPAAGLPFLDRPAMPQGGIEALWAASNQELVTAAPPPQGRAANGIQPCISCGLSLSATARFCRRCGTLQGR